MHILEKVESYQKKRVEDIIENGKNAKKYGTLFLGDSYIQYFPISTFYPDKNIYNAGVEGATSDLLFHLRAELQDLYDPRKVVLCIGCNDLEDLWQVDRLEIAFNVYRLIEIMRRFSPAIDVCVISPLPIEERLWKQKRRDNNQLRLLGKEIGNNVREFPGCVYVDVFDDFLKDNTLNPIYSKDGLHLNEEGYKLLAEKISFFIES